MNREEIFNQVQDVLVELTELDPREIQSETGLFDELGLDSIDAVDLVVKLQNLTNHKIQLEEFKKIRTVNDVVDAVENLLKSDE